MKCKQEIALWRRRHSVLVRTGVEGMWGAEGGRHHQTNTWRWPMGIVQVDHTGVRFKVSPYGEHQTSGGLHTALRGHCTASRPRTEQGSASLVSIWECSGLTFQGSAELKTCIFTLLLHSLWQEAHTIGGLRRDWKS